MADSQLCAKTSTFARYDAEAFELASTLPLPNRQLLSAPCSASYQKGEECA